MDDLMLPPLPEPVAAIGNWGRVEWADNVFPQLGDKMYTAEQMREYAKKAVEAERGAIIQMMPGGHSVDPQWVCDEIRDRR